MALSPYHSEGMSGRRLQDTRDERLARVALVIAGATLLFLLYVLTTREM